MDTAKDEPLPQTSADKAQMENVPSYGLLVINNAYNEGKITFKEWLELSRQWADSIRQLYGKPEK